MQSLTEKSTEINSSSCRHLLSPDLREQFPALGQTIRDYPLVYLDNAATTQKPLAVIEAITRHYRESNANVHRGLYYLSEKATLAYESARQTVATFLNAFSPKEIIFTRSTTEGLNLLAHTLAKFLKPGDRILLTEMEHHSNLVPWQLLANRLPIHLDFIPVLPETGTLDLTAFDQLLTRSPKVVSLTHVSNGLGTLNPIPELFYRARAAGAITILDAAQSAGHLPLDVQQLHCDFLVLSGHKMCAPSGIGVLYGRQHLLEQLEPWQGGGEMISKVTLEKSTWAELPHKFEAGTPNIEGAIALGVAIHFLTTLGLPQIAQHCHSLARLAAEALRTIPNLRIYGPLGQPSPPPHAGILSFSLPGIHPHDLVALADRRGIALRAGHHCNQPLMRRIGAHSTARASFYLYNTPAEIDHLVQTLHWIQKTYIS